MKKLPTCSTGKPGVRLRQCQKVQLQNSRFGLVTEVPAGSTECPGDAEKVQLQNLRRASAGGIKASEPTRNLAAFTI
ncbi:MAG: hypothetical protein N2C14_10900 [Planctomycetales bacterium]